MVHEVELVLGLLVAVAAIALVAGRFGIPYPILLVIGGLFLGFVPGLPHVELEPELAFLVFLPPILFAAAWFTSWRDFRANARPITQLALGLTLTTTGVVAVIAHMLVPSMGWPAAFALGAIVSPPDAVAATSIARRLGVPRGIVVVLEGESLVNDATALIAYRAAVLAALTGSFSLLEWSLRFVLVGFISLGIGLAVGWLVARLYERLDDAPVGILLSFLVPFAAYLPAEWLGASGVISVVTAGVFLGRRSVRILTSEQRLNAGTTWQTLIFLLNGLVFILIGLQLPGILERLSDRPLSSLLWLGAVVSLTVILVRIIWVFPNTYIPRWVRRTRQEPDSAPPWQWPMVLSWAGMRGIVSLAAALALPLTVAGGAPFPERDLIIFLTFCVIVATLVGQGLTLPLIIRRLCVLEHGGEELEEQRYALEVAGEAALARIGQLVDVWPTHRELLDLLQDRYQHRARHVGTTGAETEANGLVSQEVFEHRLIRHEVLEAEREAVIRLRDRGEINDDVLHRIERDLDLEELRAEA